jgi:hypothetical protein
MSTDHEPRGSLPPSSSRLGAASRRGLFPRSRLLVTGAALLAGAAALALADERAAGFFVSAVQDGLGRSLLERGDVASAMEDAAGFALVAILLLLAAPALASLAVVLANALRARHARGATSVPLPPERPRDLAPALPRLAALALMAVVFAGILGRHRDLPAAWMSGDPDTIRDLAAAIVELIAGAGAVCVLAGLAELALVRARLWSALALTRSEALRDRRAESGDGRARSEIAVSARRRERP